MSPIRLTLAQKAAFACLCLKGGESKPQWTVDATTGRQVCCLCGKPSPLVVIRNCSECDNEFIVPLDKFWRPKFIVLSNGKIRIRYVLCKRCNGVEV